MCGFDADDYVMEFDDFDDGGDGDGGGGSFSLFWDFSDVFQIFRVPKDVWKLRKNSGLHPKNVLKDVLKDFSELSDVFREFRGENVFT